MLKLVKDIENPSIEAEDATLRLQVTQSLWALVLGIDALAETSHERPDMFAEHKDTLLLIARKLHVAASDLPDVYK